MSGEFSTGVFLGAMAVVMVGLLTLCFFSYLDTEERKKACRGRGGEYVTVNERTGCFRLEELR
jgi:hypothetical protein